MEDLLTAGGTSTAGPSLSSLRASLDLPALGAEMHSQIAALYPICRSITGEGIRATLRHLRDRLPLDTHEIPTGTQVFDWTVPREWNISDAWIKDPSGQRVVDFQRSNLHVVGYSLPVHNRVSLSELQKHLFSLPEFPDRIPYRTSYYSETWGFCVSEDTRMALLDGEYEVCIEATLERGHLTYGEYLIGGRSQAEILISCHICHPSLCNDNLSGLALATALAQVLQRAALRYSYRFLFIPATIGSLAWLARNEAALGRIAHGLVLACVGAKDGMVYKRSRRGDAEIDRAVDHVFCHSGPDYRVREFVPYGYDERQYCSPGFNLPIGLLSRTPHGEFNEYHTSADNLDLVRPEWLADSLDKCLRIFALLEGNERLVNVLPKGEPQLGRRGLYRSIGGPDASLTQLAMLWVLNLSDGSHTLLDIADRARIPFDVVRRTADLLIEHGLLVRPGYAAERE